MDDWRISAEHLLAELHAKISACAAGPERGPGSIGSDAMNFFRPVRPLAVPA